MKISQPKIANIIQVLLHNDNFSLQLELNEGGEDLVDKRKMSEDNTIITKLLFLVKVTRIEGKKAKIMLDPYEVEMFHAEEKVMKKFYRRSNKPRAAW